MKIQVKGRHIVVTDPLRAYAEEKLSKLHRYVNERHIDEVTRVELELTVEKSRNSSDSQIAEATIFTRGPVLRAKEASTDMYASIDLVTEKLQRRAQKYHDKVQHKSERRHIDKAALGEAAAVAASGESEPDESAAAPAPVVDATPNGDQPEEPRVVKSKQFALKPMSIEEATLQLELVGHDFFVFTNAETSSTNVVYRRNDGHYGLIEPVR